MSTNHPIPVVFEESLNFNGTVQTTLCASLLFSVLGGSLFLGPGTASADLITDFKSVFIPADTLNSVEECTPEIYAYFKVEMLAENLEADADVFAQALDDLGEQLHDCLNGSNAEIAPGRILRFENPTSADAALSAI